MYNMEDFQSGTESALLEASGGYALLDALAQANIPPHSLPADRLESLLGHGPVDRGLPRKLVSSID